MQVDVPPQEVIALVPSQNPQAELQMLIQIFGAMGMTPSPGEGPQEILLKGEPGEQITLKPYLEIGAFRLVLTGPRAPMLVATLQQYVPCLTQEQLQQAFGDTRVMSEKRLLGVFLMLSYPSASEAMASFGEGLLEEDDEELSLIVVQGLTLLETSDAGAALVSLMKRFEGMLASHAKRGYESLVARGVVKETWEISMTEAEAQLKDAPEESLALLEKAAELDAPGGKLVLLKARALRGLGRDEEALEALLDLAAYEDELAARLAERALVYEVLGEEAKGVEDAKRALELEPDLEQAKAALSRLQIDTSKTASPAEQLVLLDKRIDATPEDASLRLKRAELSLSLGRVEEAAGDLVVARRLNKEDPRVDTLLAEAKLALGHYCEALGFAHQGVEKAPPYLAARAALLPGRVYLALNEPKRAVESFARAQRDHGEEAARLGLALAYALSGRGEEAKASLGLLTDAAQAMSVLQPIVYAQPEGWAGPELSLSLPPPHRCGVKAPDPLFKFCLSCGSSALSRRTSCRRCGQREFLR